MQFSFSKIPVQDLAADLLHVGTIHDDGGEHPLVYRGRAAFLLTRGGLVEIERDVINPVLAEEIADRARDVCLQASRPVR